MGVFGRFRHRTTNLPGGGSSWKRSSTPSDTFLPEHGEWRHLPQVPICCPKMCWKPSGWISSSISSVAYYMATMPRPCAAMSLRSWM